MSAWQRKGDTLHSAALGQRYLFLHDKNVQGWMGLCLCRIS